MHRLARGLMALTLSAGLSAAEAGQRCAVPMAEWQPRDALAARLKAEGWTIRRIKTDDGCYKAYGRNAAGVRVKAKFNPATLEKLKEEEEDD